MLSRSVDVKTSKCGARIVVATMCTPQDVGVLSGVTTRGRFSALESRLLLVAFGAIVKPCAEPSIAHSSSRFSDLAHNCVGLRFFYRRGDQDSAGSWRKKKKMQSFSLCIFLLRVHPGLARRPLGLLRPTPSLRFRAF